MRTVVVVAAVEVVALSVAVVVVVERNQHHRRPCVASGDLGAVASTACVASVVGAFVVAGAAVVDVVVEDAGTAAEIPRKVGQMEDRCCCCWEEDHQRKQANWAKRSWWRKMKTKSDRGKGWRVG